MPEEMRERISEPSGSASDSLRTDRSEAQLAKWRRRLSETQIENILRIVHAFGLDFYTRALRPDEEKLNALVEDARA
jgi:hypothetical protein